MLEYILLREDCDIDPGSVNRMDCWQGLRDETRQEKVIDWEQEIHEE